MSCTRSAEPAAEAKKAEGASRVALRTPKPPHLTGSDAWDQAESVRLMFRMLLRSDLSRESKTCSSEKCVRCTRVWEEQKHVSKGITHHVLADAEAYSLPPIIIIIIIIIIYMSIYGTV